MRTTTAFPVLLLAVLSLHPAFAATTTVEFEKPEAFTDAGRPFPESARLESLPFLREHLMKEAGQRLPADQKLAVWITDVDLARIGDPRRANREGYLSAAHRAAFPPHAHRRHDREGGNTRATRLRIPVERRSRGSHG